MNNSDKFESILGLGFELNKLAPGSILAGGAVRDYDNNKPIKDYDFFIPAVHLPHVLKAVPCIQIGHSYYGEFQVFNVKGAEEIIQFIFTKEDPEWVVENTFDLGICYIYIDFSTGDVVRLKEYENDINSKTITLFRKKQRPGTDHLERVSRKYKDFSSLVVLS